MADLPYFPFYPADWIASPRIMCLTLAQQGAYMRLLCACWMSGDCSLPDDHQKLSMISGLPVEEVKTLGPFLGPHPTKTGHITNDRLMKEWEKAHWISDMRSQAGKKSGKSRRTNVQHKHKQITNKIPTKSDKSEVRSQSHNSESEDINQKQDKKPSRAIGLMGLEQFQIDEEMNAWAKRELIPSPEAYLPEFKDYWQSVGGKRKNGPVKDWPATFRNYLRMLRDNGRLKGAQDKRQAGTCAYRVKKDSFLKPCGEPAELIGGHYLCAEHRSMKHERPHLTAT